MATRLNQESMKTGAFMQENLHRFSAEASALGFPPSRWPEAIETDLGNLLPFLLVDVGERAAHYRQSLGCLELEVFKS